MTSAVLNRIESTFMKKSPYSNPHMNSNPNPNLQRRGYSNGVVDGELVAVRQQLVPEDVSMPSRSGQFDQGEYQTLNMGSYSHSERKELKRRLKFELEQVRKLSIQIESVENLCVVGTSAASSQTHLPDRKFPSKKISGTKRPIESLYGTDLKRMNVDSSKLMKKCGQMLTKLMKHKLAWIFNAPVDVERLKLHDYYQIVKKPMDLGTIKKNLSKNVYVSPIEFAADVRLTFNNAMLYNPVGHDVHIMAEQLLGIFEGMFRPVGEEYEFESRRHEQMSFQKVYSYEELPESSWINSEASRMPGSLAARDADVSESAREHQALQVIERPTVVDVAMSAPMQVQSHGTASPRLMSPVKPLVKAKLPKPKAKDLNKREMTNDEKMELGTELQSLPEEKMVQLLQILQKRNHQVVEEEDEVELDIESLDAETLWELDRFVINWRKSLSKQKRQGLTGNDTSLPSDGEDMASSDAEVNTVGNGEAEVGKVKKGDEEDIDIGDEMPVSNFPPVEIEKDDAQDNISKHSSSSGSSSSDSSSSDSDSGSSSGSESDAEVAA